MLLILFSSIRCCFVRFRFQGIFLCCSSTLEEEGKYERVVLFCFSVLFVLNVVTFVYNRLKQSLILQTMPNHFWQISFHMILMFIFKKASCAVYWDLGMSLLLCLSSLFTPLVLLCKSALILPGRHFLSHKKKELTTFVHFLETTKYESSIF